MRRKEEEVAEAIPVPECAFCGRRRDYSSMVFMPWWSDTDGRRWCGCEEGREAGVLARLEARLEERRQEWAKSYPVYKASRPCPKCGNPTRTTTYRGGYGISPSDRYGMAFAWPYLERFCGRCEYKASEVPLDGTES